MNQDPKDPVKPVVKQPTLSSASLSDTPTPSTPQRLCPQCTAVLDLPEEPTDEGGAEFNCMRCHTSLYLACPGGLEGVLSVLTVHACQVCCESMSLVHVYEGEDVWHCSKCETGMQRLPEEACPMGVCR